MPTGSPTLHPRIAAAFQKYAEGLTPPPAPKPPEPPRIEPPKFEAPKPALPAKQPLAPPAPTPAPAPAGLAPSAPATTVPTTAGPLPTTPVAATPPTTPAPAPASAPAPTPAPAPAAATPQAVPSTTPDTTADRQGAPDVLDPNQPIDVTAVSGMLSDKRLSPEQRGELGKSVAQRYIQGNPAGLKGFQDVQAGKNTPEAQAFQAQLTKAQDEYIQQQVQADPQKAATPQGFGEIVNNAVSTFQNMPPAMQALVGIGLPIGLIGVMSSLFGRGGAGMGILGLLGLGAAGIGGAAGGLFGQDAQNFVADKAFDMGQAFGLVPSQSQSLAPLAAQDPVAAALQDSGTALGAGSPTADVKAKLQEVAQSKAQLQQLVDMPLPDALKARWLMRMDPQNIKTPEDGLRAIQNAKTLLGAFADAKSPLAQKLQAGQEYVYGSDALPADAGFMKRRMADVKNLVGQASDAWAGLKRNWNQIPTSAYTTGGSAPWLQSRPRPAPDQMVKIQSATDRWAQKQALNAMDQKELNDLEAQQAEGVPYRIDDARRHHQLRLRQQASAPAAGGCAPAPSPLRRRVTIVMSMKSARCWAGYEPVPGKKPYSEDSCRPIRRPAKKKKGSPAAKKK